MLHFKSGYLLPDSLFQWDNNYQQKIRSGKWETSLVTDPTPGNFNQLQYSVVTKTPNQIPMTFKPIIQFQECFVI